VTEPLCKPVEEPVEETKLKDAEIQQEAVELMEKVEDEEDPSMWRCATCDLANKLRHTVSTTGGLARWQLLWPTTRVMPPRPPSG